MGRRHRRTGRRGDDVRGGVSAVPLLGLLIMLKRKAIAKWKMICVVVAFLTSAAITAATTDSYLLSFIRIAECGPQPPKPGDVLIKCWDRQGFYFSGSIYLNVDKELVQGLQAADVVVMGNSRTG